MRRNSIISWECGIGLTIWSGSSSSLRHVSGHWEKNKKNPMLLCMVYNEMGSFYRGTSRYQESLSAFRKSQELVLDLKGRDTADYAVSVNNIAGTYRLMGEYEQAVSLFWRR